MATASTFAERNLDLAALVLLSFFIMWLYSNAIYLGKAFDDYAVFDGKNKDAEASGTPIREVFTHDFWGKHINHPDSNKSYRPTVILTFRLQHYLMGYRHDMTTLHVVNYIMAYINVCLVYYLARLYMKPHADSADGVADRPLHVAWRRCAIPFAAALLFLAHPVHVDSVTSIVGRCELMCCFFGLCALFTEHAYLCVWGCGWHVHVGCVLLSTVLMILSVTSKDSGIAYCGVFVVHACAMYLWGRASLRRTIACTVLSVAQVVVYCWVRIYAMYAVDLSMSIPRQSETPHLCIPPGAWHWLAIRWVVTMKNLELLFFPTKLCVEYAFNCIPHLASLSDERLPMFCAVSLAVLCYVSALVYCVLRYRSHSASVQLVLVLWAAVLYAPVSHFFVRIGTFIAERCLYGSSVGVVLLLAFVFVPAEFPSARRHWAGCGALSLLVMFWLMISHRRNLDWNNNLTLFTAALDVCPNSGKAHLEVARSLLIAKKNFTNDMIRGYLRRAIELDEELGDAVSTWALFEMREGNNLLESKRLYCACLAFRPEWKNCQSMHGKVRDMLYPQLDAVTQIVEDANCAKHPSLKIQVLHDSSVVETMPLCGRHTLIRKLLQLHRELTWEYLLPQYGVTDCSLLPVLLEGYHRCVFPHNPIDAEDEEEILIAAEDMVVDVRSCDIPWHHTNISRSPTFLNYTLRQHQHVLSQAENLLYGVMQTQTSPEIFHSLLHLQLELQLRRYCHASAVLKDVALLQLLPESSIPAVAVLRDEFTAHHVEWRASIVHAMSELNRIGADIAWATEDEMFQCVKYY